MRLDDLASAVRASTLTSVTELAQRAGVSRPTAFRIMKGAPARIDDLRELAIASGLDIDARLVPLSDPCAAVACRIALGDPRLQEWADQAGAWTTRLSRGQPEPVPMVERAGTAAGLMHREGVIGLRAHLWDVDRLVSAGRASRAPWALSGWAALDALGLEARASTVFWAEDARTVAQLLGDTFTRCPLPVADVLVIPAHPSVFVGSTDIEGVVLVDPLQALIDAVGLGPDARSVALRRVDEQRDALRSSLRPDAPRPDAPQPDALSPDAPRPEEETHA